MKKSTGKAGSERAAKTGARAPLQGDVLAALEQQQRDLEELIERFDSGSAQPDPDDEPDGERA
jgi:hypothetical protein